MKHYHDDFQTALMRYSPKILKTTSLPPPNEISIPAKVRIHLLFIEENSQSNINLINNILSSHSGKLEDTSSRYYNIVDGSSNEDCFIFIKRLYNHRCNSVTYERLNGTESKTNIKLWTTHFRCTTLTRQSILYTSKTLAKYKTA